MRIPIKDKAVDTEMEKIVEKFNREKLIGKMAEGICKDVGESKWKTLPARTDSPVYKYQDYIRMARFALRVIEKEIANNEHI